LNETGLKKAKALIGKIRAFATPALSKHPPYLHNKLKLLKLTIPFET